MFVALGLSGVIPVIHFIITDGFHEAVFNASVGWLVIMASLYISGAVIYANRVPEKIWPGKFDIWVSISAITLFICCNCSLQYQPSTVLQFQSHQIFHVLVVAGALVHYHGITQVANYRLTNGGCVEAIPVM